MKDTLNPNEWIVMEALWAKSPATLGEAIDRIGSRASWNYKTYQSYMNVHLIRKARPGQVLLPRHIP